MQTDSVLDAPAILDTGDGGGVYAQASGGELILPALRTHRGQERICCPWKRSVNASSNACTLYWVDDEKN